MKILLVTSSPNPSSASAAAARFALSSNGMEPFAELDTVKSPPPAYGAALMSAVFGPGESPEAASALAASDAYVEQVLAADAVVVASPMHNFGVPSGLKAWMDQMARPGRTFEYGPSGSRGLLGGKPVLLIVASGGRYDQGESKGCEHAASHLKSFFEFLGMQATVVAAGGMAGEGAAQSAQSAGKEASDVVARWLEKAAGERSGASGQA